MDEVTELQSLPDAHIPLMKFKFDGIPIDLLYASISLLVIPEVSIELPCVVDETLYEIKYHATSIEQLFFWTEHAILYVDEMFIGIFDGFSITLFEIYDSSA